MFWELANDIKRYVKLTVVPALRNLFASKRSLAGIFLVMLVMQILLSVICVFGIENIKNQQAVLGEFEEVTETMSHSITYQEGSFLTSDSFKTAMSSSSVFVGALIIWGICAISVYQKVMFASADRDKYIWGMYITHGAKKKKVKGMLKSELYLPHAAATVIAYPASIILCNLFFKKHGHSYGVSILTLLAIILLSYICIRLVVEYQCFLIKSMSCNQMLRNEDSPKSISFPRKFSKLVKGFTPIRYGTSAFMRMRKYYISLALISAIPAVIWICFSVSSMSQTEYLSSDITEFSVTLGAGVSEEDMRQIQNGEIPNIDGVSGVKTTAAYDAQKLYSHLLVDGKHYTNTTNSPYYTTSYADNRMTLCCSDRSFKSRTGFSNPFVPEGSVIIITPKESSVYNIVREDRIFFAISKKNGSIRPLDKSQMDTLADVPNNEYSYVEMAVAGVSEVETKKLDADGYLNVDRTYVLLNPVDYQKIVGASADKFSSRINVNDIPYISSMLRANGSFDIKLLATDLSAIPVEGDCVEFSGSYTGKLTLTDGGKKYSLTLNGRSFNFAYINSVTKNGFYIDINLTPYDIIELEKDNFSISGNVAKAILLLGTPELDSADRKYCAATYKNYSFTGTSLVIGSQSISIYSSTAVTAQEVGTHAILKESQFKNTSGAQRLESLHADNNFDIACGDTLTPELLGYDLSPVKDGYAVLVLPKSFTNYFSFSAGDKLRLAVTADDVAKYNELGVIQGNAADALSEQLAATKYAYVTVLIDSIIYRDGISRPCIFLSSDDFSSVIAKKAPYARFTVSLDPETGIKEYSEILTQLNEWTRGNIFAPSVSSTGSYLQHLLRKHANYETLLQLIGSIVPLIIPFIWYYPLVTLFDRRKTEVRVLEAMGKKRLTILSCFTTEGVLTAATAFAAVLALCLPATLIFKIICTVCKLPLEFSFGSLKIGTILIAAAISAACAAVSFAICCATTSTGRIKKKRKEHGNS